MFVFPLLHPRFTPQTEGVEPRPGHDGSLWSFHVGMRGAIQAREEKQMEKKWKPNCFALCNHSPPSFFGTVRSDQDAQTEILTLIIIFCGTSVSVLLFRGVAMLPAHKDPGWHS